MNDKVILCPHCGKPMHELATKKEGRLVRTVYIEGDREDDLDWGHEEKILVDTWKCDDCGIRYTDHHDEYVFPSDYEQTITPRQRNYIRNLCSHNYFKAPEDQKAFWEEPFITSIELASSWIHDHVVAANELQTEDEFRVKVMDAFDEAGMTEYMAWNHFHGAKTTTLVKRQEEQNQEFISLMIVNWNDRTVSGEVRVNMNLSTASDQAKLNKYIDTHYKDIDTAQAILTKQINTYKDTNK